MSKRREIFGKLGLYNDKKDVKKRSRVFLLPMLEMELMHKSIKTNYIIDVSLIDGRHPEIICIFDNIDYEPLRTDIYKLQNHECFLDIEYGDDYKEIIVHMKVPDKFLEDFDKFMTGKYSQFSEEYKNILVKVHGKGRKKGINPKNGLPNISPYDVIYPEVNQRKLLAEVLSTNDNIVNWEEIKEVMSPIDPEIEKFKRIGELEEKYGIK